MRNGFGYIPLSLIVLCGLLPLSLVGQLDDEYHGRQNATINFYGKVVDLDGKPVEAAKVNIELAVGEWKVVPKYSQQPFVQLKIANITLQSGADGSFTLKDHKGHGFEVKSVEKEGYELSKKVARSYAYSATAEPFHPDPTNPVVFKMWKKRNVQSLVAGGKETLIYGGNFYGVNPDGRPYTLNLLENKKIEGTNVPGDLIVRIQRPLEIKPRTKFDWSCSIEVVDGGILHTNDEFLYSAPESGYQPKYEVVMLATNIYWQEQLKDQQFYLKSRNGKIFGSTVINIIPNYNDRSVFDLHYTVNPSGSRSLEK